MLEAGDFHFATSRDVAFGEEVERVTRVEVAFVELAVRYREESVCVEEFEEALVCRLGFVEKGFAILGCRFQEERGDVVVDCQISSFLLAFST